ncbi:helix-turn-helix domain-containing protein [Pseudobutyrivibrio sp.]|uniref:helix-turn-helix domain-containing protein n=1 Tax=Pseudobutyrivibrio sp. TaxID=2014367 RepID=UPI001B4E1748|nr:helix-turn-helix transcriptional regulator [Pseudobutyrivibrio sp.]MBP3263245.1 helix-turn-helix domain-containing protein [Pseudobutyrivibrio sp.]
MDNLINLPANVGHKTLNDLLRDENVTFQKKGNKITINTQVDNIRATINIEKISSECLTVSETRCDISGRIKDHRDTITKLKNNGLTQQEIADKYGVSQSYISQLLRESK